MRGAARWSKSLARGSGGCRPELQIRSKHRRIEGLRKQNGFVECRQMKTSSQNVWSSSIISIRRVMQGSSARHPLHDFGAWTFQLPFGSQKVVPLRRPGAGREGSGRRPPDLRERPNGWPTTFTSARWCPGGPRTASSTSSGRCRWMCGTCGGPPRTRPGRGSVGWRRLRQGM